MGLLSKGTPLSWEQSRKYHDYIKNHGIQQFLMIYNSMKDRENDIFLWGDEAQHLLVVVDPESNTARLLLRAPGLSINSTTRCIQRSAKARRMRAIRINGTRISLFPRVRPIHDRGHARAALRWVHQRLANGRAEHETSALDDPAIAQTE